MNVLVLGSGLMGTQIGCDYALGGHHVTLVGRSGPRVALRLKAVISELRACELIDECAVTGLTSRIGISTSLDIEGREFDMVVESLPEEFPLKSRWLSEAGSRYESAILASNTSSLSIANLGAASKAPERMIGTHYMNPPALMPLVEVVATVSTATEVCDRVTETLQDLGKTPIHVKRDVPGFVWNRLQSALLREALWLVQHEVVSPEVVDQVFRQGLAPRWISTGPIETVALGGVGVFQRLVENIWPDLSDAVDPDALETVIERRGLTPDDLQRLKQARDQALSRWVRRGDALSN